MALKEPGLHVDKVSGTKLLATLRIVAMTNLFRVCGICNIVPSLTSPLPLHTLSQQFLQLSFEPTGQRTSLISAIAEQKHHSRDITPHFSSYSLLSVLASLVIAFIPYPTFFAIPFSHLTHTHTYTHLHTHAVRRIQAFDNGCGSITSSGWRSHQETKVGSQWTPPELWQNLHRRYNRHEENSASNWCKAVVFAAKFGVWWDRSFN